jgi:hypothetical protein
MTGAGWTLNPLVVIGIGIAVMFFGYFFGLFEGRGQGYKKRQKEDAEDRKQTPLVESLPPASPPAPSDEIPVLDVSMAPDGGLRLKMDGQRVDTSALGAEQRKRLIAILTQMRPWLEAPKKETPPPQPKPASPSRVTSSPTPARPAPAPAPATGTGERPTAPPPPSDDEEDERPPAPQSMVAQIDSVLQAHLAGTPLANFGIRLQESPEGGVLVWVGVSKYEGIDEVPNEEIKAALRAAITEWENTYTPGL